MGNACTSCNCNNQNEPSELLTVDNKVLMSIIILFLIDSWKELEKSGGKH
jgi:hypothetical protein